MFLAVTGVAFFAWLAVMALDAVRFRWSQMPPWLQGIGALLLLDRSTSSISSFARTVICLLPSASKRSAPRRWCTGLYRYVRYPTYAAFVLFTLGTALLLGSWYGLLGGLLLIGMIAWRAVQEEQVLREELEGYKTYTRVRYRFVPYVG